MWRFSALQLSPAQLLTSTRPISSLPSPFGSVSSRSPSPQKVEWEYNSFLAVAAPLSEGEEEEHGEEDEVGGQTRQARTPPSRVAFPSSSHDSR